MPGRLAIALMIIIGLLASAESMARDGGGGHGGGFGGARGGNGGGGQRSGAMGSPRGDSGVHGFGGARGESGVHGFGSIGAQPAPRERHGGEGHFNAPRHHHYGGTGFFIESPYSQPNFYYWPYYTYQPYYSSPTIITPSSPPTYIDQGTVLNPQSLEPNRWDYCPDPAGYYPYVQDCPGGWEKIEPQPIEQQPGYWYYCSDPPGYYPYVRECSAVWQNVVP